MPTVYVDCEWGYRDGRVGRESAWVPVVLCASVGGNRHHFLGRCDRLLAFVEQYRDYVWVGHNVVAEMSYLLRLGVRLPPRWWCTMVGHRAMFNRAGRLDADLVTALTTAGLAKYIPADKDDIRERILHLRHNPAEAVPYCFEDVDAAAALHDVQVGTVNPVSMHYWTTYLAAVARIELRGVPVDLPLLRRIWRGRPHICEQLRQQVNEVCRVYRANGSFSRKAFLRWCRREGIRWPLRPSDTDGRLRHSLADEVMEEMAGRHTFIGKLRDIRKTLRVLDQYPIRVDGRRARHHYSNMPFRSVTGRNQPSRWIFGAPKWMRFLVTPPTPDHILITADYRAQEIGVAAALSGDPLMKRMYDADDPHLAFAEMANAIPLGASADAIRAVRKTYKTANLAILYGQTATGLADRLGVEVERARELLQQHRDIFSAYHDWSDRVTTAAYQRGFVTTRAGWRARVDRGTRWRTWANFPVQANSADVMRLTTIALNALKVEVVGIVHDGWVVTCHRDDEPRVRTAIEAAKQIACDRLLGRFPLRMDVVTYPDRYADEDGQEVWEDILRKLPGEFVIEPE
jgi:hypothetical protein